MVSDISELLKPHLKCVHAGVALLCQKTETRLFWNDEEFSQQLVGNDVLQIALKKLIKECISIVLLQIFWGISLLFVSTERGYCFMKAQSERLDSNKRWFE